MEKSTRSKQLNMLIPFDEIVDHKSRIHLQEYEITMSEVSKDVTN